MYLTTTGVVVAQLTRLGRQLLADNSANFRITKYAFSDDEINYGDFDGSTVDAANTKILGTPVLEADTVGGVPSQRYNVFSAAPNTIQLSSLDIDADKPFVDGQQYLRQPRNTAAIAVNTDIYNSTSPFRFKVRTFYGFDTFYLLNASPGLETGLIIPVPIFANVPFIGRERVGTQMTLVDTKPQGIPCSDPYESDQHQSDGIVFFHPTIAPQSTVELGVSFKLLQFVTQNVNLPQLLGGNVSNTVLIQQWLKFLINRLNAGLAQSQNAGKAIAAGSAAFTQADLNPFQYIDQYGETGLALGSLTIRGSDTGQLFTVEVLLYSASILSKILTAALAL